jgi:hypothetical protein
MSEVMEMIEFDINDLPDMPVFEIWPVGTYDVEGISLDTVQITYGDNSEPAIELKVKLEKVQAIKPADAVAPEVGAVSSWEFRLTGKDERGTAYAQGRIKQLLAAFLPLTGGSTSSTAVARAVPGSKLTIVTGIRLGKLTKEQKAVGEQPRKYPYIDNIFLR